MKKFLGFACVTCVFGTLAVYGQTVSQAPHYDPFSIDRGSSFSASTRTRQVPIPESSAPTAAAGKIVSDVREALEVIRRHHADGAKLDNNELTKSSVGAMLAELDPHSNYFDAAEFSELLGEQDSEYSGTGSTISN